MPNYGGSKPEHCNHANGSYTCDKPKGHEGKHRGTSKGVPIALRKTIVWNR